MSNMAIKFAGVNFKNPIVTASGTFGFGREYSEFYPLSILGGVCTKGLTREKRMGNSTPRIAETPSGILNSVGLQNPGVDYFIKYELPFLKESDTVVIANIAGNTEEDYIYMAEALSDTNVDMLEMNISCPNVKKGGMAFGIYPDNVKEITEKVKKYSKKPLIVKLSPNVASISENAKAAESGGADGISLINTLGGMAVDINTRRPILANVCGGLSGACVKPVALKMVYEASKAVSIPIMGLGGVMDYKDAVEFMLCGASIVQVGTANISNPLSAKNIVEDLTTYCEKNNINNVSDLIGKLMV